LVADDSEGLGAEFGRQLSDRPEEGGAFVPEHVQELGLRHHPVAVHDQVLQHVEDLGLELDRLARAAQLEGSLVQLELPECVLLRGHPLTAPVAVLVVAVVVNDAILPPAPRTDCR